MRKAISQTSRAKWNRSVGGKYNRYLQNCKKLKIEWRLTKKEAHKLLLGSCKYCGKECSKADPNGIDKVDNDKGFVPDNCVSCCIICNWWKHTYTVDEFLAHAKKITEHNI